MQEHERKEDRKNRPGLRIRDGEGQTQRKIAQKIYFVNTYTRFELRLSCASRLIFEEWQWLIKKFGEKRGAVG